jgi:hypothetical protein
MVTRAGVGVNIWSGVPVLAEHRRVVLLLHDLDDSRWSGRQFHVGMEMDLAPAPRERHLLFRRDVLIAEEDDAVVEQRAVNGLEGRSSTGRGRRHGFPRPWRR